MMTYIDYPLSIRTILLSGNSRQQEASFIASDSRSGKTYFKKRAQNQNTYINVTFRFVGEELMLFQSWFRHTLNYGFLSFNMYFCTEWGNVKYECRFMPDSLLTATKDTPAFSYTAMLLVYNYGPPIFIPPDLVEYPDYITNKAKNWLDIIINKQLNKVT